MSATLTKGYTFGATELVTSTKLSSLVDSASITGIINTEISAVAAIAGSKLDLAAAGIIGGTTPAAITGTTITADTAFVGDLTGDVTGDVTGDLTGDITSTTVTGTNIVGTIYNLVSWENEIVNYENDAVTTQ